MECNLVSSSALVNIYIVDIPDEGKQENNGVVMGEINKFYLCTIWVKIKNVRGKKSEFLFVCWLESATLPKAAFNRPHC